MTLEQEIQTDKFQNPQHKTALNIIFTSTWLRQQTQGVFKNFGLSSEQYNVLRILRGQHPKAICLKDITARMLDKNSNTTRIVDKLVIKKWVECVRSTQDKRELKILITNEGLQLLAEIDVVFERGKNHLAPNLTDEECEILNQLLDKIRA